MTVTCHTSLSVSTMSLFRQASVAVSICFCGWFNIPLTDFLGYEGSGCVPLMRILHFVRGEEGYATAQSTSASTRYSNQLLFFAVQTLCRISMSRS